MTERQVRKMRDLVYGVPATDTGWAGCRENWMRKSEIEWLQREVAAIKKARKREGKRGAD